jgi:ribose transport system permease protein
MNNPSTKALPSLIKAYGTVAALLLICIVFAVLSPNAFATLGNAVNVSRQIAFLVLVAVGASLVMSLICRWARRPAWAA